MSGTERSPADSGIERSADRPGAGAAAPAALFDRLWSSTLDIGRLSGGGYQRLAWTAPHRTLLEWFTAAAAGLGGAVGEDHAGNTWAWWGDPDAEPGVVLGSHLDSVPAGGAFDGPLGVAAALAAVGSHTAGGVPLRRPVGVVCFAEEEGGRFGVPCVGSRLLTGALTPAAVLGRRDRDGLRLLDACGRPLGPDPAARRRIGCYLELHIEQGRALDQPVGLGTGIWPHGRWRYDLVGAANHAGTTALVDRDDPMLRCAELVLAVRRHATELGLLATVGRTEVEPNAVNTVPSLVRAWLDARAPDDGALDTLLRRLGRQPTEESRTPAVQFDTPLAARVAAALPGLPRLATGAGHDAGVLQAAGIPAAMLFVRNPTGVSHAPAEHAERADCLAGVEALTTALGALAR